MLLASLLTLLPSAAATAENIYKWVDKDGKVHFGDKPETQHAPEQLKLSDKGLPTEAVVVDYNSGPNPDGVAANSADDTSGDNPARAGDTPVFDRKLLLGRWRVTDFNDLYEEFKPDGSYSRYGKLLGNTLTIKGSWRLAGNILHIQVVSETAQLPSGETKTQYKTSSRQRTLLSVNRHEIKYLWQTADGEMESTLVR
ncbi:DUF4124 domain-containing protein [Shewanella sp. JM162201]|uniref:DUF4124 domain-containing protein n=1 Tax=Shewanella jiangmenensis TaxID=2837387 RepID=A0ABS5V3S8_9GAMM|nr:DUF4124 domain-containing protein [Shewanella jiangmenensis]MBT1444349.1 DUF4124 domain-containing protein [Shewanella jiangmenensis]